MIKARPYLLLLITTFNLVTLGLLMLRKEDWAHSYARRKNRVLPEVLNDDSPSFADEMREVSWTHFKNALVANDTAQLNGYSNLLMRKLVPFLIASPAVPSNDTCGPPSLQMPAELGWCDQPLKVPRKIGILLQFGFDVDILEVHFHELDAVVDKFFILESIKPHNSNRDLKPLMWERLKDDSRFVRFLPKIVHFIVDDADLQTSDKAKVSGGSETLANKLWKRENLQERLRWEKFLEWNAATGYFDGDDLLGFGDVDEIPHRDTVFYLKHCPLFADPVDVGIWFPIDGLSTLFRSDFPVKNHPYTLGDPTFWTLRSAIHYSMSGDRKYPSRMRGRSPGCILGGIHMSQYAYPPFQMIKELMATESYPSTIHHLIEAGQLFALNRLAEGVAKLESSLQFQQLPRRIKEVDEFRLKNPQEADVIIKLPWFYRCNPSRYPSVLKEYDLRLGPLNEGRQL